MKIPCCVINKDEKNTGYVQRGGCREEGAAGFVHLCCCSLAKCIAEEDKLCSCSLSVFVEGAFVGGYSCPPCSPTGRLWTTLREGEGGLQVDNLLSLLFATVSRHTKKLFPAI